MNRCMPSLSEQATSESHRNHICRLGTPGLQADVSGHLRNWAVAEVIALIGTLDSHASIKGRPSIRRGPAKFQQRSGTRENPFCHVAPCNLLLNGADMSTFFKTAPAQKLVARIYGMGVIAPDNWAELNTFDVAPVEQNRADSISERYSSSFGLVAAFEATAANAASDGKWDASGKRQHNRASLEALVQLHYYKSWKPMALEAYHLAITHLSGTLAAAVLCRNEPRAVRIRQRIQTLEAQRDRLLNSMIDISGATNNVIAATVRETLK